MLREINRRHDFDAADLPHFGKVERLDHRADAAEVVTVANRARLVRKAFKRVHHFSPSFSKKSLNFRKSSFDKLKESTSIRLRCSRTLSLDNLACAHASI